MGRPEIEAMDAEANAFAMELLMPEEWLRDDARGLDICDEAAVARLAKKYRVPVTAMAIRLGELMATTPADGALGRHDGQLWDR